MNEPEAAAGDAPRVATLLFVDDEKSILTALNRIFRPAGYRVLTAEGGAAGLEILANEKVDLVVSDMRMPEMDGAAFLAEVAKRWPRVIRMLLTGYADISSTINAINNGHIYRYISKPWDDNDLKINIQRAVEQKFLLEDKRRLEALSRKQTEELKTLNDELKNLNANLEKKVAERTQQVREAHDSLQLTFGVSIQVFSNLIEMKEGASKGHAKRVANHAKELALKMGLSEKTAQDVFYAGLLHNIGKISLPDQITQRPYETLQPKERQTLHNYPVIGSALLMALEPLSDAAAIIRAHRELFDGTGYPDKLSGSAIPTGARILSVVSDYDLLQLGLLMPQAMTPVHARSYLDLNRRKRYDPEVVKEFLAMICDKPAEGNDPTERTLSASQLLPGMVLSRDLTTPDGMMLLARDSVMNHKTIDTVLRLEKSMDAKFSINVKVDKK